MKNAKRIFALLLVLVMALAMAMPAFASTTPTAPTTGTITINNAVNGVTYTLYQLLKAELDTDHPNKNGTYPITYYIDKDISSDTPNPVYTVIKKLIDDAADETKTGDDKIESFFVLTPTTTAGRYIVTYNNSSSTTLTDDEVNEFKKLGKTELELLPSEEDTATGNTLEFAGLEFGYYMVQSKYVGEGTTGEPETKIAISINSTNPTANIYLKDERTPSNPDKVQNRTEVWDGEKIEYNSSVRAVNYVRSSENGTSSLVLNYSMTDIPDYTSSSSVAGNDPANMKIDWVRVYDADALRDAGILDTDSTNTIRDGDIITDDTGLYKLKDITSYVEIPMYTGYQNATPNTHFDDNGSINWTQTTDTATGDNVPDWKKATGDTTTKVTDYGYYMAKNDTSTIRIPWATAPDANGNRSSLYYPESYIVIAYEQTINENINDFTGSENDMFDGTYTNYVKFTYGISSSSEVEIGEDSVTAFVTGISLRKHPIGYTKDENTLPDAKYIAYKTETDTTGEGKTKYYSYHEYTDTEYKALYDKVKDDYIRDYNETNEHDPDDDDINTYLADYMAKNPECHTAWIEETGKVDPKDFTTFKNATILKADNQYKTVEIKNLADDVFYLQEVEAPAGYKCPNVPYLVTVKPTTDMTSSQKHFTVTISNQGNSELADISTKENKNQNNFFTVHLEDGTATTLPSTGGAGTVALIAIGSLIFVSTGIVLVAKKRVYNEG